MYEVIATKPGYVISFLIKYILVNFIYLYLVVVIINLLIDMFYAPIYSGLIMITSFLPTFFLGLLGMVSAGLSKSSSIAYMSGGFYWLISFLSEGFRNMRPFIESINLFKRPSELFWYNNRIYFLLMSIILLYISVKLFSNKEFLLNDYKGE